MATLRLVPRLAPMVEITDRSTLTSKRDAELEVTTRRMLAHDEQAENQFFRAHLGLVTGVVSRLLGSGGEVEDVTQEVFLQAFRRRETLKDPLLVRGWLAKIAIRKSYQRLRQRRIRRWLFAWHPLETEEAEAKCDKEWVELRLDVERLKAAVDKLPLPQRTVWLLRRVQGLSLLETCEASEKSLATVKRWISDADDTLSEFLGGEP